MNRMILHKNNLRIALLSIVTLIAIVFSCKDTRRSESKRDVVSGDTVESKKFIEYSDKELQIARQYLPGGVTLTNDEIRRKLEEAWTHSKMSEMTGPAKIQIDSIPTEEKIKRLMLEGRGEELSFLDQRLTVDNKSVTGAKELTGTLEKVTASSLQIKEQNTNKLITLDFSYSPGMDVSAIAQGTKVSGKFTSFETPAGTSTASMIRDQRGLLFAGEARKNEPTLTSKDLDGISIRQQKENVREPAYASKCAEVYFVAVSITGGDNKEPLIIEHGRQALLKKGKDYFLVRIIKSQYIKEIPCGDSFEEEPWQLDYVLTRVDDDERIKVLLRNDFEKSKSRYPADSVSKTTRDQGDRPPNPEIEGGDNE